MSPRAITQVCPQCAMPMVLPLSYVGKTIACSRCGHAVLVSGPDAPVVAPSEALPQPVLPPQLNTGDASPPAALPPFEVEGSPAAAPRGRSCLTSGCLTVVSAALVLAGVVGVALLMVYLGQLMPPSSNAEGEPEESPPARKFNKREYTDASRKAITIAGVTVRIDKVQLGKVDYRSNGEILQTATPHYLIVTVNVKNKERDEPVTYQSWYDHEFEDDAGHRQDVELRDGNGVHWTVFRVPRAENVERHITSETSLPLGDDITDSLVFKLPEEYVDEPIPPLYLKLPAAAVGDDRTYRFHLPAIMVDRRDR